MNGRVWLNAVVTAVVVLGVYVSDLPAEGWTEDFEGYAEGLIGSPWEDTGYTYVYDAYGYPDLTSGQQGLRGTTVGNHWEWGRSWRPTGIDGSVDGVTLTARVNAQTTHTDVTASYHGASVGFVERKRHSGQATSTSTGYFIGDTVKWNFSGGASDGSASLTFMAEDYEGDGYVTDARVTISGLSWDTWYDVRITLTNGAARGEYKASASATWIVAGTRRFYDDFMPNYVGCAGSRQSATDDIVFSAEPGWIDAFENYMLETAWSPLPWPWEDASSMGPNAGLGYGGGWGCQGPGTGWNYGHAWRPIHATHKDRLTVVGRLYLDSGNTYQNASLNVTPDKSYNTGAGYPIGDLAKITLFGDGTGAAGKLVFMVEDYESGGYVDDTRIPEITGLSADTWYDVKMLVDTDLNQVTA